MAPARHGKVEELYRAALEQPAADRPAFLSAACGGDDELQRVVEALLANSKGTELRRPAREDSQGASSVERGSLVGHYRVDGMLGAGGMGVVYRATDTRLDRTVAIKFLSGTLLDADARRRFQREAQLASTLNHPHIVTVHDVGEHAGAQYIVTELVDGCTLADWLHTEPRTWRQKVDLVIGVADALATAHDASVLHRDIKPGNILVSRAGYAKLADFGLAKSFEPTRAQGTVTTRVGALIGTVEYMAPEQLAKRPLDARSDVFAFGVVLYEALAGRRPFGGHTDVDLMHAIMHAEPEPLPADLPEALRTIVEKAIEKDPAERYQSMRDLVVDLRRVLRHAPSSATANRVVEQRALGARRVRHS
jgi:eukaryotic-like serine/threonine-protein kinase